MILGPGGDVEREQIATEDCPQKNVRVSVYDVGDDTFYEIPTVDARNERDQVAVEVQVRKDGPGAITKLSDIYFPATWKGVDVFNSLPPFDDSPGLDPRTGRTELQPSAVPVWIEARPYDDGYWQTLHYGWLRKIGSGGDGRLMRMRVDDYVKLLQATPASKTFSPADASVQIDNVLSYVEDALGTKGYEIETSDEVHTFQTESTSSSSNPYVGIDNSRNLAQKKTFDPSRDTLVDVLDWLVGKIDGGYWYVGFDDSTNYPTIVLGRDLQPAWESKEVTDDDAGVTIRKNLAMEDLNPVNTISVTGQTGKSIAGIDIPLVPDSDFPVAKVRHTDLFERAGYRENSRRFEVEERTIDGAVSKAKKLLREEIGGAGEASMVLSGNPSIIPFGTIRAKPVCDKFVQGSVDPFTYGIERVTHEIPATGTYTTTVDVGVQVRSDDIEVVDSQTGEVGGTETTADDILNDSSFGRSL